MAMAKTRIAGDAARGMLLTLRQEAIPTIHQRLQHKGPKQRTSDLFLSPIFEQTLLLAEDEVSSLRKTADQALNSILTSASLANVFSGVYVNCHRQRLSRETDAIIEHCLTEGDEALTIQFLVLAPNIPQQRLSVLFYLLDRIWERHRWREQENLLELLERLVPRDADRVMLFIEQHTILKYVFNRKPPYAGSSALLRILIALAGYHASWGWTQLLNYWNLLTPRTKSRELHGLLLAFLCGHSLQFDLQTIASRFTSLATPITFKDSRSVGGLSDIWGCLWSIEWTATAKPISSILQEIASAAEFDLITRLKGLAYCLLTASAADAEMLIEHFLQHSSRFHQAMWTTVVLPLWLRGDISRTPQNYLSHNVPAPSEAVQVIRGTVAREITKRLAMRAHGSIDAANAKILQLLCRAVVHAEMPATAFREMLSKPEFAESLVWLEADGVALLLIDGYLAEHPGAQEAMQHIAKSPQAHWGPIAAILTQRYAAVPERLPTDVIEILLDGALHAQDETQLLTLLYGFPEASQLVTHRCHAIFRICQTCMQDTGALRRRKGILLWLEILRLGEKQYLSFEAMQRLYLKEDDTRIRGQIVTVMGFSAVPAGHDVGQVVAFLERLAIHGDINLRQKAMDALVRVITDLPEISRTTSNEFSIPP